MAIASYRYAVEERHFIKSLQIRRGGCNCESRHLEKLLLIAFGIAQYCIILVLKRTFQFQNNYTFIVIFQWVLLPNQKVDLLFTVQYKMYSCRR
jgi:hypothetical protein